MEQEEHLGEARGGGADSEPGTPPPARPPRAEEPRLAPERTWYNTISYSNNVIQQQYNIIYIIILNGATRRDRRARGGGGAGATGSRWRPAQEITRPSCLRTWLPFSFMPGDQRRTVAREVCSLNSIARELKSKDRDRFCRLAVCSYPVLCARGRPLTTATHARQSRLLIWSNVDGVVLRAVWIGYLNDVSCHSYVGHMLDTT